MGIALLDQRELQYYSVKRFPKLSSPHANLKMSRKFILRLIADFNPDTLCVEKAFFANNRNASLLSVLVDEIKAIGRRKKLKVVSFAPSTMKKHICGNGRASKKEVSRVVVSRYPELSVFYNQDRKWKETYHQNMFDAVALGIMSFEA